MKKISAGIIVFLVVFGVGIFFARAQEQGVKIEEEQIPESMRNELNAGIIPKPKLSPENCFDYYKFGSVDVSLQKNKSVFNPGEAMDFLVKVKNNNNHPIVDGVVYTRIGERVANFEDNGGNNIIDEFAAVKNVNLFPGEEKEFSFAWVAPLNMQNGDYEIDSFFNIGDKFAVSGLSSSNEAVASYSFFQIRAEGDQAEGKIIFDRTATKINGKNYSQWGNFIIEAGDKVSIVQPFKGTLKGKNEINLTYDLYYWDGINEENKVQTKKETISSENDFSKDLLFEIPKMDRSVYFLRITAESQVESNVYNKAIINLKVVSPQNYLRISYPGVTSFPIKKGDEAKIFACFHNGNGAPMNVKGKVIETLLDKKGNKIAQAQYEGDVVNSPMAIKGDFKATKDYDYLKLQTVAYDENGKETDKYETVYDCEKLGKDGKCPGENEKGSVLASNFKRGIAIGTIILLLAIAIYYFIKRKKGRNMIMPTNLLFLLIFVGIFLASTCSAATTTEGKYGDWGDAVYSNSMYIGQWDSIWARSLVGCLGDANIDYSGASGIGFVTGTSSNLSCSSINETTNTATCSIPETAGSLTFSAVSKASYIAVGGWDGTPPWYVPTVLSKDLHTGSGLFFMNVFGNKPPNKNSAASQAAEDFANWLSGQCDGATWCTNIVAAMKNAVYAKRDAQNLFGPNFIITSSNTNVLSCGNDFKCNIGQPGTTAVTITIDRNSFYDIVLAGKICIRDNGTGWGSLIPTNLLNQFDKKTFTYNVTVTSAPPSGGGTCKGTLTVAGNCKGTVTPKTCWEPSGTMYTQPLCSGACSYTGDATTPMMMCDYPFYYYVNKRAGTNPTITWSGSGTYGWTGGGALADCNSNATVTFTCPDDPVGYHDSIFCQDGIITTSGWSYDPQAPSASLDTHFYEGSAPTYLGNCWADQLRGDVNSTFGITGNHGFSCALPGTFTGSHAISAYAINAPGTPGNNPRISNSPQTANCCSGNIVATPSTGGSFNLTWVTDVINNPYGGSGCWAWRKNLRTLVEEGLAGGATGLVNTNMLAPGLNTGSLTDNYEFHLQCWKTNGQCNISTAPTSAPETLTVNNNCPNSNVTSSPGGINCGTGPTCSAQFNGATVNLSATGGRSSYGSFTENGIAVDPPSFKMDIPRTVDFVCPPCTCTPTPALPCGSDCVAHNPGCDIPSGCTCNCDPNPYPVLDCPSQNAGICTPTPETTKGWTEVH